MPEIHPSAVLDGDVRLADDVRVGPGCVLTGPVSVGQGSVLVGHVYLYGPLEMGAGNIVYPFACLGFAPQHVAIDRDAPAAGLVIGEGNTFREHVTVHRAMSADQPTRIGSRNWFMAGSHAGHDCVVGDGCVLVNGVLLAGHVTLADRVTIGGGSLVHQHVRIGRGAMLGGGMGTGMDIAPLFMLTGINICGSVNIIGMRRAGMTSAEIDTVRWVHKVLCRSGLTRERMVETLATRAGERLVDEYLEFVQGTRKGICTARPRGIRGTG